MLQAITGIASYIDRKLLFRPLRLLRTILAIAKYCIASYCGLLQTIALQGIAAIARYCIASYCKLLQAGLNCKLLQTIALPAPAAIARYCIASNC